MLKTKFIKFITKPLSHGQAVTAPLQGRRVEFLLTSARYRHLSKAFFRYLFKSFTKEPVIKAAPIKSPSEATIAAILVGTMLL